jgi:hypothetical protein
VVRAGKDGKAKNFRAADDAKGVFNITRRPFLPADLPAKFPRRGRAVARLWLNSRSSYYVAMSETGWHHSLQPVLPPMARA